MTRRTEGAGAPGSDAPGWDEIVDALRRYAEASDRITAASGNRHGVYRTDLRALTLIMQRTREDQDTSPSDLGRMLDLTSAATTALVDRMVANGHVERVRSTTDRRRVLVRHTDSATAAGRHIFAPIVEHLRRRLEGYTADELHIAASVLRDATTAMHDAGQDPPSTTRDPCP